jgi:hypothetical protein
MNWKEITVSPDWTCFRYRGEMLFNRTFKSVLKFKGSGLAPVQDDAGWYIINPAGDPVIPGPFRAAWGFYEGLCAVEDQSGCYHIGETGQPAYPERYAWCGNFQEGACPVRDREGQYVHIRPDGSRLYAQHYRYCGDFKDGFACVMLPNGRFKHIDAEGKYCYKAEFHDLGVYHKGIATARDAQGWFHIDLAGKPLYPERYAMLEPLYNGAAFGAGPGGEKRICTLEGDSQAL